MSLFSCCFTLVLVFFILPIFFVIHTALNKLDIPSAYERQSHYNGGMLMLNLETPIHESPTSKDAFLHILSGGHHSIGVFDLYEKIKYAETDEAITGIIIYGSGQYSGNSLAQLSELRQILKNFKETSNKPIFAYLENPSQTDYYVASVASKIFMNPVGMLEFKGVNLKGLFIGEALKKYGVNAQLIRAGKYKSAGEIFTSDKFSNESRQNYSEIAAEIWKNLLTEISVDRNLTTLELQNIASNNALLTATDAEKLGLVNAVLSRPQFEKEIKNLSDKSEDEDDFLKTELEYYDTNLSSEKLLALAAGNSIAILYLDGEIVDGSFRRNGYITSNYYAQLIRKLRNNDSIKAVVLRINSPGGSAYASEILRTEIELLKEAKPVVSHFSGSAASGAYWLAAGSTKIFADKNSLTGSIGVFGLVFAGGDLAKRFGITFDSIETSELADIMSGTRPMTEKEQKIIQNLIDKIYSDFIDIVSSGRNLPKANVEEIAQGKVWLASLAQDKKLVDSIGTIFDAIAYCKLITKSPENIQIMEYPTPQNFRDMILDMEYSPFAKIRNMFAPKILSETLERIQTSSGIRAQSTHILTIEN